MIDTSGPFQITLNADVLLIHPELLKNSSDPASELVELITALVTQHAEEGGFRLTGTKPVVVDVIPKMGPVS